MLPTVLLDSAATVTQLDAHNRTDHPIDVEFVAAGQVIVRMPVPPRRMAFFGSSAGVAIAPPLVARHNGSEGALEVRATVLDAKTV